MNPLTLEWVEKAEGDLDTALREVRARKRPNFDSACFHAQQLVEKYLKAWLQENGAEIPHIHSLVELSAICIKGDSTFTLIENDLKGLDGYAVHFRYPGRSATKEDALLAIRIARHLRKFVRIRISAE